MSSQPEIQYAAKGSQRWLQIAVNERPQILNAVIAEAARLPADASIAWYSPLRDEKFVEYRDGATIERLELKLESKSLRDFWPAGGPVWDGLAKSSSGEVFLVEAKAHVGEMVSGGCRASEPARTRIAEALRAVQMEIAPGSEEVDWSKTFYQYANRLAHLHLLRSQNGVPAHLVFVYFLNATDVNGPSQKAEYEGATKVIEHYLGLRRSKLSSYVHKVYVDVNDLLTTEVVIL